MANFVFDLARESFLKGEIDWSTEDIKCILVDTGAGYTPSQADQFLDDVTAGTIATASAFFTTKTTTAGVADADNITFTAVTGAESEALIIYQHTGTPSTSRLIAHIDTATGLAITPGGGDITVTWDDTANKIFKL
jgi:hypothetical protein